MQLSVCLHRPHRSGFRNDYRRNGGSGHRGLAVIFLLRLVIYSTGYTQVQIGGAAVSKRLRLLLGDKLKKIPWPASPRGRLGSM